MNMTPVPETAPQIEELKDILNSQDSVAQEEALHHGIPAAIPYKPPQPTEHISGKINDSSVEKQRERIDNHTVKKLDNTNVNNSESDISGSSVDAEDLIERILGHNQSELSDGVGNPIKPVGVPALLLRNDVQEVNISLPKQIEINTSVEKSDNESEITRHFQPESLFTYNCSTGGNPYCLNDRIPVLVKPRNICDGVDKVHLLMLITSAKGHHIRRHHIRHSWGDINATAEFVVRRVFLFGVNDKKTEAEIHNEHEQFGDVLQGDFRDTYRNLTLKTIMAYSWLKEACPNVAYVMKTDDDMFINVIPLLQYLRSSIRTKHFMIGSCYLQHFGVPREPNDRWHVSYEQYPDNFYPPYCCGCGYVVSGAVARDVADVIRWLPIFPIEDAFIGVAIKRLPYRVNVIHDHRFAILIMINGFVPSCEGLKSGNIFTLHQVPYYDIPKIGLKCPYIDPSLRNDTDIDTGKNNTDINHSKNDAQVHVL